MKTMKYILILMTIFVSFNVSAQYKTPEGFEMGSSMARVKDVYEKMWKDVYKYKYLQTLPNGNIDLKYEKIYDSGDIRGFISFEFENDKLIHYWDESGVLVYDAAIENKYIDLVMLYGEPTIKGSSTIIWKKPQLEVKFSFRVVEGYAGNLFREPTPTQYLYTVLYKYTGPSQTTTPNITGSVTGQYSASGSGFVISTTGLIVTNYHVVDKANGIDVLVNRNGGVKTYKAKILISDKTNDISIIKIEDNSFVNFPTLPYAVKTPILDVGTSVFALGYPMSNILGEEIKVTDGIISSKTGYQGDIVTYQISAPIQPGNSGGPLFDKQGNLVGITNAGVPDAQNVGYAIKASYLRNLVDAAPTTITLPATNSISGLSFTEKIKRLTPYVVLIKIY